MRRQITHAARDEDPLTNGIARKLARGATMAVSWTKQALNAWMASATSVLNSAIALEGGRPRPPPADLALAEHRHGRRGLGAG